MLFPERNCGVVVSCCFETDLSHSVCCEIILDFQQKRRTDAALTKRLEHVNRDDVSLRGLPRRQTEANHLAIGFRDDTLGARKSQIIPQLPARICYSGFVARLVNLIEFLEIFLPVSAKF